MCDPCWAREGPDREPVRRIDPDLERCAWCGQSTRSGIYVRVDPDTVPYPRDAAEWVNSHDYCDKCGAQLPRHKFGCPEVR